MKMLGSERFYLFPTIKHGNLGAAVSNIKDQVHYLLFYYKGMKRRKRASFLCCPKKENTVF
jgi:hypothetical protein